MRASLDWRHWRCASWLAPGVLPPWANTEAILLGIMVTHGIFSFIIRPLYQHGLSKTSRDRPIMAVSAAVGFGAAAAGTVRSAASSGRVLPWSIAAGHVFNVYHEAKAAKRSQAVIDGAASTVLLLVLEGIRGSQESQISGNTWLSVFSTSLSVLLLVIFLSVPRGNPEFHEGSPVDRQHTASIIELLAFLWPRKVFKLENLKRKDIRALPVLSASLRTATLTERHRRFASQLASHRLGFVLLREYLGPLTLQSTLAILNSLTILGPNLVTYRLLQHLSGEHEGGGRDNLFLALLLGVSNLLPIIFTAWMNWVGSSMIDIPMRHTLGALTYQKVLSLPTIAVSPEDKEAQSMATLLHMNALSARACSAFPLCYRVVGLLTQLVSTTAVLVALVGWKSVAIAIAAALLITPLSTVHMKRWTALLLQTWKLMTSRNAVLQDALLAIRQIKLSAAEPSWKQKIYKIREKEVQGYYDVAWLRFWMVIVSNISPAVLSGIPIYLYAWQGDALTASVAFTFISLFKELQSKLYAIPQEIPRIRAGWASAGELDSFLRKEEISESQFVSSDALSLRNATITWHSKMSEKKTFQLAKLDADFPTGELSIITGKTGCGKSLLLSALAGEAKILSGDICRPLSSQGKHSEDDLVENWVQPGNFAFVSQTPWMDNATIQDNILFGLPMDEERYARVLYCCALDKDLIKFKDGDMTVITIKGVSLSGGQRSRIALARALYSQASFLLMDDVLSAVDTEVREWIVEKALCGSLASGRTRVLVTHHEEQVRSKISYRLLIHDQTATGELISKGASSSTERGSENSSPLDDGFNYSVYCKQNDRSPDKEPKIPVQPAKPDTTEETFRVAPYIMYFNASGGATSWLPALTSLAICEWNQISASSWLEEWVSGSEASPAAAKSNPLSPGQAYLLMSALTTLTMSMRGVVMFRLYRVASKRLFYQMMEHIFGAPLQWLESTSQGEILQRCDRYVRIVDEDLTYALGTVLTLISRLVTVLWSSASFSLYNTPLMIGLFYLYFIVGRNLIPAAKYLTAIDDKATSIFSQHRSSLYAPDGVSTVRAYGMKDHFFQRVNQIFDKKASTSWHNSLHSVVTDFQLGFLGAVYVALSCYSILASGAGAGTAGAALSFAVQFSETVSGCLQRISAMESGLRIAEKIDDYGSIEQEPTDGIDVGDSWPEEGELQVSKYTAGYGPGLPDTLRGVTFTIKPGERVGVVGRTGAGKSTLALSFARLIEKRDGIICVDSVDISRIKLEVLRKRILIIPQDPHLFGGTLRAVIDPDGAHSDEKLVASLQQYRFFSTAANVEKKSDAGASGLSFMVSDGGANLSQGQRQILCLVKAMLSGKKVVIMDEATSAVDMETDSMIQTVIRDGLRDTTVMVIAHRLATVAHLDTVLVMHDGKVTEFGKPAELYQQEGQFWTLVNHSVDREDLVKSFNGK